jgi:hypothetical protein
MNQTLKHQRMGGRMKMILDPDCKIRQIGYKNSEPRFM